MENAVLIGLSQQMALKRQMDITANNIANMNTTAYKGVHPLFEEYLPDNQTTKKMSFVQDYGVYHETQNGAVEYTGRPLDMAITGPGYFPIETEGGILYSRNGSFRLDNDGYIITVSGDKLLDEDGNDIQLEITSTDVDIAPDGTIDLGDGETAKIELTAFDNEQLLKQVGNGYYNASEAEGNPSPESRVLQGSLEKSNVQPILEMTTMVEILRSYQSAQKLLDAEHDMQMKTIEELPAIQ